MPSLAQVLAALRREDLLLDVPPELPEITGVTTDSRTVVPGMLYVAVRGSETDGHRFVADAARRGAAAALVEVPQDAALAQVQVRDGRRAALAAARAWHGVPSRGLVLVGVTGTNGKTTTTGLLRHLLNGAGTAGSVGTLGAFDGAGTRSRPPGRSPRRDRSTCRRRCRARRRGATHGAMEASSHSLDQGRLDGLRFEAGVSPT